MLCNSNWFRPSRFSYGVTPTTWQGWLYIGLRLLLIAVLPIAVFDYVDLNLSMFAWPPVAMVLMAWDSERILRDRVKNSRVAAQ